MNQVEIKFKNKYFERAGLMLLKQVDAIDYVKECKLNNIAVLGVDGFVISENTTEPSLENSIDVSTVAFTPEIYEIVINFLKEKKPHLFFEVVT